MSQWTIRYGEFVVRAPLTGLPIGIHGVLTIYNPAGVPIRWFDGQATDPTTGAARPIGSQFTGQVIHVHTGVGASVLVQSESTVANLSEEGANRLVDALFSAQAQINAQNLPYQLPPGSWGREPTNSNSVLATLFKIAGMEMPGITVT
jgi:hypothetical protein